MVSTLAIAAAAPGNYPQPRTLDGMSFGSAAQRARALPGDADCPCGGGRGGARYGECCGPFLAGAPAPTPEQLMRSRFTAFALGDAAYLSETWHPSTAPERLDLDAALHWERLEIVRAEATATRGTVEFRALWRPGATRGVLHEVSRFRFAAGRWYYVDGEVEQLEQ